MNAEKSKPIRLNIPFYRQHYEFTCGPASLMMAMKYFDANLPLTRNVEMDIWRESNMIEIYGTSRFGLAYSAATRGFCARATSNTGGIDYVDRLALPIEDLNEEMLKLLFNERKARCKKLGVEEKLEAITSESIYNSLASGHIPLVVTNALFLRGENLPHWIAITGIDDKFMYFNNPLSAKQRNKKFLLSNLEKVIGYQGDQSMVEIWKAKSLFFLGAFLGIAVTKGN